MNPTRDEVMRITNQMEEALSLEISPLQLLELAQFAGIEPNFSGIDTGFQALQDLRDEAREGLTIHEVPGPRGVNLARYRETAVPDKPFEFEPLRRVNMLATAMLLCISVAAVVAAVILWGAR